jgi:hypothetical protein
VQANANNSRCRRSARYLRAVSDHQRRPSTVQALVAAVKRESRDQLRMAMLILLLVIVGALCPSAGYLIGVRDIGADDVEAAGTWFGAIATLATVIIAGRVFLSDRLYQDYQVAYDLEREREEKAEESRKQLAQAPVHPPFGGGGALGCSQRVGRHKESIMVTIGLWCRVVARPRLEVSCTRCFLRRRHGSSTRRAQPAGC